MPRRGVRILPAHKATIKAERNELCLATTSSVHGIQLSTLGIPVTNFLQKLGILQLALLRRTPAEPLFMRFPGILTDLRNGAGRENRTLMACLEGRNFTIKLYPRDFRRIMRGSAMQSTAIVPFSQPVAAGSR